MEYLGTDKPVNKIQPVVSVCITTYNHEAYIAECLDSILMQETDFPYEIIVGEDDSTDGTREICKEYAENHPDKIRLFLRDEKDKIYINGVKTGRFNYIENLKAARGRYIATCDGDDYSTDPLKLQKQYDFMEGNEKCFMITHAMPSLMKSKEGWYGFKKFQNQGYLPHASNFMFRRFDMDKYYAAFMEMLGAEVTLLYIAATEGEIYHSSEVVSHYRITGSGIYTSLNEIEKAKGEVYQLKMIKKHFKIDTYIYRKRLYLWLDRYFPFPSDRIYLRIVNRILRICLNQVNNLSFKLGLV